MKNTQNQLPKGWEIKKLDEVCELITCGVAARPNYVESGIPFLSAKNVKNGQIIWDDFKFISEKTHTELTKNNKPMRGDILYTRVGSYGEAAVIGQCYEFSIFVSLTLIKNKKSILNNYYLRYFLNCDFVKRLAKESISGSGVGNLNVGTVRKFPIPLPPLSEQQRIVSILDRAFAAIDKAKENAQRCLNLSKELFQSYLQSIFNNPKDDWETKKLGDVCEIINGGTPKSNIKEYWNGTVKWITPADLGKLNSIMVEDTPRKISEIGLQKSSAKLFPENSVILSTRAPIGHLVINSVPMSTNQGCRGLVPHKDFDSLFLYYFLKSNIKLLNELGTGTTFLELSTKNLSSITINLPSLSEQQSIVNRLDNLKVETQKLEMLYQNKIAALEELKKSLLQKAFSGKLNTEKEIEI